MKKIRILIVDDHSIVRDGLRSLIEKQKNMEVIGEANNGRKAVSLAKELEPDVLIMDIAMPDLNGIDATQQILATNQKIKIIGLSMYSDHRFVTRMLKSGAKGYLLKDCAFDELASAIETVILGQIYISPRIKNVNAEEMMKSDQETEGSRLDVLSLREREVLQIIAEGKSTKEIAVELHVSTKTIETHRQNIMNKLNIRNVVDLTKFAIQEGLISLEP